MKEADPDSRGRMHLLVVAQSASWHSLASFVGLLNWSHTTGCGEGNYDDTIRMVSKTPTIWQIEWFRAAGTRCSHMDKTVVNDRFRGVFPSMICGNLVIVAVFFLFRFLVGEPWPHAIVGFVFFLLNYLLVWLLGIACSWFWNRFVYSKMPQIGGMHFTRIDWTDLSVPNNRSGWYVGLLTGIFAFGVIALIEVQSL